MHFSLKIFLLALNLSVLASTSSQLIAGDNFSQASIEIITDWLDVEGIFRETNSDSTIDWVSVMDNGRTSGTVKINASVDSNSISQTFNFPDLTQDSNADGIYDFFDLGLPWAETLAGTQIEAYLGVGTVQLGVSGSYNRQQGARDVVMNYSGTVTATDLPGTYVGQWFPFDPTYVRTLESSGTLFYDRASNTYETVLRLSGSNDYISNESSFQANSTDSVTLKGLQLPNPAGGYHSQDITLERSGSEYRKQIAIGGVTYFVRIVDSNDEDSNGIPRLSDTIAFFDTSRVPGSWSLINWFGPVYSPAQPTGSPWLYHSEMGWLYLPLGQELGSLWIWDQEFGWLWTSSEAYPYLYHNSSRSWLYFGGIQDGKRIFYHFSTESWINQADGIPTKNFTVLTDLEMIWVEPGTFMMGSPLSEPDRYINETQHQVTLTDGFWLGKYEATQAQWRAVMGTNPSWFTGDNLPVERVSWEDVMAFCAKLNGQESASGELPSGYAFTLPTEAQWEYACRAGTTGAYAGDSLYDLGWYSSNGGSITHAVGLKAANPWGFHDMHGNVYEWCADWYGDYPSGRVTDPLGPGIGSGRVLRGGSWIYLARYCRSAHRYRSSPVSRHYSLGFRLCLSPVKK